MNKNKRFSLLFRGKNERKNIHIILVKIIVYIIIIYILSFWLVKKKKIGIIGIGFGNNIGNILLKYAIFIKIKELGFDPYIIGNFRDNANIKTKYFF